MVGVMTGKTVAKQSLTQLDTVITVCAVTIGVFLLGTGLFVMTQKLGAPPSTLTISQTGSNGDPVVAKVNGSTIRWSDILMARQDLPPEFDSLPQDVVIEALVEQLIDRRLIAQAAWREGIEQAPVTKSRLNFQREKVLRDLYMVKLIEGRVSDVDINTLYEARYLRPDYGREAHVSQILVRSEKDALAIGNRLNKDEDFAAVAREASIDGSAVAGGDLGFVSKDSFLPQLVDSAFKMEAGTISQPIRSQFGWHILKVEAFRSVPPPPLYTVRDQLRRELVEREMEKRLEILRSQSEVDFVEIPSSGELDRAMIASQ